MGKHKSGRAMTALSHLEAKQRAAHETSSNASDLKKLRRQVFLGTTYRPTKQIGKTLMLLYTMLPPRTMWFCGGSRFECRPPPESEPAACCMFCKKMLLTGVVPLPSLPPSFPLTSPPLLLHTHTHRHAHKETPARTPNQAKPNQHYT
jgi:hypothetical protein